MNMEVKFLTSDAVSYLKKLEEIQNGTTTQDTIFNQTPDEDKFIINADTREISVPSSFSNIGVIYDHNAETIFFKIPRYFDNVDLNDQTCIIQYINAGKEEDIYTVTQKDLSNEGEIIFGWKITNSVTKYFGSVSFAVRFYSITNGVFNYNLNTKIAQFNVLNGLNITADNINVNPDILSQWIEKINALDNIELPMRTSELINDSNFLTSETDPTVPKWAKQSEKPTYTAQEVGAVDKSGGAISETIVDNLETIETKFPIPTAGETIKRFLGKVMTFLTNIKPLESDVTYYVATTGSDTTGDGSQSKPFKSTTQALRAIPKDLGGHIATIFIGDGTYGTTGIAIQGFYNGTLRITGNEVYPGNVVIPSSATSLTIGDNYAAKLVITGMNFRVTGNNSCIYIYNTFSVTLKNCIIDANKTAGINWNTSLLQVTDTVFNRCNFCIMVPTSSPQTDSDINQIARIGSCTGTENGSLARIEKGILQLINDILPDTTSTPTVKSGAMIIQSSGTIVGTLQGDVTYYVSPSGSDSTGDGTSTKPFKTIQRALGVIPSDLGRYTVTIYIADGTYDESIAINGYHGGVLNIMSQSSPEALNTVCKIRKMNVTNCSARVQVYGIYFTQKDDIAFTTASCHMIYVRCCHAIESAPANVAFNFSYTKARMSGCRSINHINCVKAFHSEVSSENWTDSSAVEYGLWSDTGGKISKAGIQPGGTLAPERISNGGIMVSKYSAIIGTLQYDILIYVSPTGSDTANSGSTESSPFKTIKYALSTIPKDLGGYTAKISIADGTYDEGIDVRGYNNGILEVKSQTNPDTLSTVCRVNKVYVSDCTARIRFYGLYLAAANVDSFVTNNCTAVFASSCQAVESAPESYGFNLSYSRVRLIACRSANHNVCIRTFFSELSSENWVDSSAIKYGISIENGSIVSKVGVQPSGTVASEYINRGGGIIIDSTGTQISNVLTTGLSCTWGTVQGGYVRHGNINAAMITVQIRVPVTVALTANQQYVISGFPKSSVDFGIACNMPQKVTNCFFSSAPGEIRFTPTESFAINDVIAFNFTYLTVA